MTLLMPRAGPLNERLIMQRIHSPSVTIPCHIAAQRNQRDNIPWLTRDGGLVARDKHLLTLVHNPRRNVCQFGQQQQQDVGQLLIEPPAQRAKDDNLGCTFFNRQLERQAPDQSNLWRPGKRRNGIPSPPTAPVELPRASPGRPQPHRVAGRTPARPAHHHRRRSAGQSRATPCAASGSHRLPHRGARPLAITRPHAAVGFMRRLVAYWSLAFEV